MKKHTRNTRGPGAWVLGGVASLLMCVSAWGQYVATQSSQTTIPDSGAGNPYPSIIDLTKSNIVGTVEKVSVTLNGLTHPYAPDIGMLLVGPNGKAVVLMSNSGGNSGGSAALNNVTLILSDDAANPLPVGQPLSSGSSYKPTDNGALDLGGTGGGAPSAPYPNTTLTAAFAGANPNGQWKLYVFDTTAGPNPAASAFLGSWSLSLQTTPAFTVVLDSLTSVSNIFGGNVLSTFANENGSVTVNLALQDSSTPTSQLTVSGTKLDTLATNFTSNVSGSTGSLTITPNAFAFGTNTLTITVGDGIGSVTTNITLAVLHQNQAPTIALSTNSLTTVAGFMTTNLVVASLTDADTNFDSSAVAKLNLTVASSDSTVVAPAGVFFTNLTAGGEKRGIAIIPAGAGHGTATLTISVDDTKLTNSQTITVTVLPTQYPVFANTATINAAASGSDNSTIVIPNNTVPGLIGRASVFVNGLQGFVPGSSTLTLTAPNNATVNLIQNSGPASAHNYGQVLEVDGAGGSLPNADNVTNTIFLAPAPDQLASLVGVNPNGTWKLTLQNGAATAAQIVDGWTLNLFPAPTISGLPSSVNLNEGQSQTIPFTVAAVNGSVTNVSASMPGNLANFTGTVSGNNASLTITGKQFQFGTNTVTVTVEDNSGFTTTATFTLGLKFVDNPPVISFVSRQVVPAGGVLGPISFSLSDPDSIPVTFSIRANSDNQKLIPDSNIVIVTNSTGNPSSYSMMVFPIGTQSGSANITLTANDGTLITQSTFNVFVQVPDFPLFAFTGGITINAAGPGTPYAATNVVSGLIGKVENVKVTLFGLNDVTPSNLKVLLVAPDNTSVLLLAGAGGSFAVNNTTLVFDDAASSTLVGGSQIVSGVYKPSPNTLNTVAFPAPAPAPNYGTTLSALQGVSPNGNWQLYVTDTGSSQKGSIAGGYQLSIQTSPSIPAIKDQFTTVNVSTNVAVTIGDNQPGSDVTVTASVTSGPTDVLFDITNITVSGSTAILQINPMPYAFGTNVITVVAKDGAGKTSQNTFTMNVAFAPQPPLFTSVPPDQSVPAATQLGPLNFSVFSPQGSTLNVTASSLDNPSLIPSVNVTQTGSSGNTNSYQLSLIPAGVSTGKATITIQATDGSLKSSATFVVTVVPTLAFANTGSIAIPAGPTTPGQLQQGEATPYPSVVKVGSLGGVISSVQVTLVGLNHQHPEDLDVLLVAPDNSTAVMLMAHAGSGGPANGLRVNFSDSASAAIPQSSPLSSQSYKVADYSGGVTLPTPAPVRPYKTTLSGFNGLNPNGSWQLYVLDDTYPTAGSIDGGWILYIQTAPGIAAIGPQTTPENTPLAVPLSISDASTDPTNLTVQVVTVGAQRPPDLVDSTNLVVTGTGASRTLTITPFLDYPSAWNVINNYSNAPGTNLIQVTVNDPINNTNTVVSFPLTVTYVNQSPTITTATNGVYFDENSANDSISFNVGDVDSYVFKTNVMAISSNEGLISKSNIVVALANDVGPGASATVTVTLKPNANVFGSATLSLIAGDLNTWTTNQVTVNINHIWQQPTINPPVSPQPVIAGSATTNIAFTVGSVEVDPKSLLVYATSDNTALVPNSPANIILGGSGSSRTIQLFTLASSSPASANITIFVTDQSLNVNSTNSKSFTLSATPINTSLANTAAITTSGAGKANLYPSTIQVSGLVGATFKADVVLPNFNHSDPANLDVLLVEESTDSKTNAVVLMSGIGGTIPVSNLRLQFDDAGTIAPPNFLASGTYAPANYTTGLILPPPAPTNSIWSGTLTKAFAGLNPNGNWKLFVNDRGAGDSGNIASGWQLIVQTAPTIAMAVGTPSPLHIAENGSGTATIDLQDMFIDPTNMTVTASSDNQALIPDRNVTFGKITSAGFNGTVYTGSLVATLTPATLQSGTAHVTFTVTRSDGAIATVTQAVSVDAVNVAPTISRLDPISMPQNTTSNFTFIINDPDTPLSSLNVVASSTDGTLIPSTSLIFQGFGTNRLFGIPANNGAQSSILTVTLDPVNFQVGSSTISITVTDAQPAGLNVVSNGFVLTVTSTPFPPFFISSPKDQSVSAAGTLSSIPFAVASPITAAGSLTVAGTSSDQTLVKNSNITFTQDGSGTNRTVTIKAEANTNGGTATITLTLTDPTTTPTTSATAKFNVSVRPTRVFPSSNNHIINIVDNAPADVYPSQIVVSNLVGPISKVTATLNGFTHSFASDVGVLLVAPSGKSIVLMDNLATGRPGPTNVNLTFDQSAATAVPANVPVLSGSYLPLDNSSGRVFAGVPGPYTNTSLNVFNGASPNGTWSLYVQDFVLGDSGAISNGWTLNITTLPVINGLSDVTVAQDTVATESFTVTDDNTNNTVFNFTATSDNQSVVTNAGVVVSGTFPNYTINITPVAHVSGSANITVSMVNQDGQTVTKTIKATFTPVVLPPTIAPISDQTIFAGSGATVPISYSNINYNQSQLTVTFQSSNTNLVPVSNIKLSGNSVLISPVGVQTGSSVITVTVTNPGNLSTNASFTLNVNPSPTPVFAQTQTITINDNAAATPYPSILTVSGLSGNISKVTASLAGFAHSYPADVSVLLVGPQGQAVVLMSRAGGSFGISNTRLTFDDSAAGEMPQFSLIADGTYQPTDYKSSDTFFPTVPAPPYSHALSAFNGTNPNGTWSLYVQDDSAQNSGVITGGWVLNITTTGPVISPVITSVTTPENTPTNIQFNVSSTSVNPSNLIVSVSHANDNVPGLIQSLTLGGFGSARSLLITPGLNLPSVVTNVDGQSQITLSVSDGTLTNSIIFPLIVSLVNQAPTISGLSDQSTAANVPFTVNFTVADVDTALSNLVVAASTSNPLLGTASVSGSGGSQTLAYQPAGAQGVNTVSVTVSDGVNTTTNTFQVTLTNGVVPVVGFIPDTNVNNTASGTSVKVNFAVDSGPLGTTNLSVVATADNTTLVPLITVTGDGTNFTANLNVAAGLSGVAHITVFARDEFGIGTNTFSLTVSFVSQPASLKLTVSGTQLTLAITGQGNVTYDVQDSTDLKTWTTVSTVTADASGNASYTAPISASNKLLVFRVKAH